jgi:hypothetical protein
MRIDIAAESDPTGPNGRDRNNPVRPDNLAWKRGTARRSLPSSFPSSETAKEVSITNRPQDHSIFRGTGIRLYGEAGEADPAKPSAMIKHFKHFIFQPSQMDVLDVNNPRSKSPAKFIETLDGVFRKSIRTKMKTRRTTCASVPG